MWMSGNFHVGSSRGHVERIAAGRQQRRQYSEQSDIEGERQELYGRVRFSASGAEVGGALAGNCGYSREERRDRAGSLTLSRATGPLFYHRDFLLDGRPAGMLDLQAAPPLPGNRPTARREGEIRFEGKSLSLHSVHQLAGTKWPVESPLGYEMRAEARSSARSTRTAPPARGWQCRARRTSAPPRWPRGSRSRCSGIRGTPTTERYPLGPDCEFFGRALSRMNRRAGAYR